MWNLDFKCEPLCGDQTQPDGLWNSGAGPSILLPLGGGRQHARWPQRGKLGECKGEANFPSGVYYRRPTSGVRRERATSQTEQQSGGTALEAVRWRWGGHLYNTFGDMSTKDHGVEAWDAWSAFFGKSTVGVLGVSGSSVTIRAFRERLNHQGWDRTEVREAAGGSVRVGLSRDFTCVEINQKIQCKNISMFESITPSKAVWVVMRHRCYFPLSPPPPGPCGPTPSSSSGAEVGGVPQPTSFGQRPSPVRPRAQPVRPPPPRRPTLRTGGSIPGPTVRKS